MNIAGVSQWSKDPLLELKQIKVATLNKTFDKFIIYGQAEWEVFATPGFYEFLELAEQHKQRLIAISGAAIIFKDLPLKDRVEYQYYPTYFITHTFAWLYQNAGRIKKYIENYNKKEFQQTFITYNYRAHAHRCEMIDLVYINNLFENNNIIWHHNGFGNYSTSNDYYQFKHWNPVKLISQKDFNNLDIYWLEDNYWNSFAQLVSESTEEGIFITEKTAMPLFLKKPFLVATAPGFHQYLKYLGFELYDEVFNYDFDSIPNRTERYNRLLQNFKDLKNHNCTELYEKIQDKIEYNRKHAIKIATQLLYAPDIITETLKIHNTGERVDSLSFEIITQLLPQSINTFIRLHGEL